MRWGVAVLALGAALLLGGCVLGSSSVRSSSCGNMPNGACQEQIDQVSARHPGARSVDIECRVPRCTRAAGAGTVVVTYPDGSTRNETFSYTGDPNPAPAPACIQVAADACQLVATSVFEDQPPSATILSITVACRADRCTREAGDTEVTIGYADGTSVVTGYGWAGAP